MVWPPQSSGGLGLHKETENSETEGLWLVLKDTWNDIPAIYLELLGNVYLSQKLALKNESCTCTD